MSDIQTKEWQVTLLTVSLLIRSVAKGYEPKTMKAALLSINADEVKQLEALGLSDTLYEAGAALCQGALEGVAETIEALSHLDDAKWLEVVKGIRDNLKAEAQS